MSFSSLHLLYFESRSACHEDRRTGDAFCEVQPGASPARALLTFGHAVQLSRSPRLPPGALGALGGAGTVARFQDRCQTGARSRTESVPLPVLGTPLVVGRPGEAPGAFPDGSNMVVTATPVSKSFAVGHRHEPPRLLDRFGDADSGRGEDRERLARRQEPDGIAVDQVQRIVVPRYSQGLGELAGPVGEIGRPSSALDHDVDSLHRDPRP